MNRELRTFADELRKFGEECENIIGIVMYGSLGRDEEDYFSDGDFIIYTCKNVSRDDLENGIRRILYKNHFTVIHDFYKDNKWVIFAHGPDNYILKLEIAFSEKSNIKNDIIYIIQSRINDIEKAVILDKDGIKDEYIKNWICLKENVQKEFYEILDSFIYYYDGFLCRFTRGDVFRAYMNYTISFYKLASMAALSEGEYRNLYQPWFLTRDIIKDEKLREMIYEVSSTMDPIEIFNKKSKLVRNFFMFSRKAAQIFDIEFNSEFYKDIMDKIEHRYYEYYNFRDIAKIINYCSKNVKLKSNKIFRSASLSRYDSKVIESLLKEKNIFCIIDLRDSEEIQKYKIENGREYNEYIKKMILHIPISIQYSIDKYDDHYKNMYYAIITQNQKTIGEIFKYISKMIDKGALIIHCEGGRDRVGIIIALLLDMLGVERECIIEDYMASFNGTSREIIEFLFNLIDNEFGGTMNYLKKECNVKDKTIKKLTHALIN